MIDKLKKNLGSDGKDRGTGKKIVALLFFGAIILVFVFMSTAPDQMGLAGGGVVAEVNSQSITINQLREMVRRMEQRFGGGSNPALQKFIQGRALEDLIDQEIVYQGFMRSGMQISNDEIKDFIINIPAFQEDGRFQRSFYENYLRGTRQTAAKFEGELRREAASNRLRTALETALLPADAEIVREREVKKNRAQVEFLEFSESSLEKGLAKKAGAYPTDEDFSKKIKEYYSRNKGEFTSKEEVHAQHILVKFKADDKSDEAAARKKIDEIAVRVKTEDFSKLAKSMSQDAVSKSNGGDLGFFVRGEMVPEFEQKAFSMQPGQISEPVKSQFGFHLIKLLGKKKAETKPLENVREQIGEKLYAKTKIEAELSRLKSVLEKGDASGVKKFARRHKLKWQDTGVFDLSVASVPKIGVNEDLFMQSFRLSEENRFGKKPFIVAGKTYVIRYKKVSSEKTVGEVLGRDELLTSLNQNKTFGVLKQLRDGWKKTAEIQRRL